MFFRRRPLAAISAFFLIIAASAYFFFLRPAALKHRVHNILSRYLYADISLGSVSFHPVSGLSIYGISARNTRTGASLFDAEHIVVGPRWLEMLKFRFAIKRITLENASFLLKRAGDNSSNWADVLMETPAANHVKPPLLSLRNCKFTINDYKFQGVSAESLLFPLEHTIAIKGSMYDPFWGNYTISGEADRALGVIKINLQSTDLAVTEEWVRKFPFVGENVWNRYHPTGIYDFSGTLSFSWNNPQKSDYSLLYTAKDASCNWLIFPVVKATGRLFVDPGTVIINHLRGEMFDGSIEGYSIINLDAPATFFNRYAFEDVDMAAFLNQFQIDRSSLQGKGNGYMTFQGDHSLGEFQGKTEIFIPRARFWKFPIILSMLSQLQLKLWTGDEPLQDCKFSFTFSQEGIDFQEISLVSDVMDIYGDGHIGLDDSLSLICYVRPVTKTPFLLTDFLLQQAIDSLSGTIAQFEIAGTVQKPSISLIPLTPLNKKITQFFDAITKQRLGR